MEMNTTVSELLNQALSNPNVAIAAGIQFFLGLALGYVAAKAAKYITAFIIILALGAVLNVWSLGGTTSDILTRLGENFYRIKDAIMPLLQALGILTVGPVSIGFFVGVAIAMLRK